MFPHLGIGPRAATTQPAAWQVFPRRRAYCRLRRLSAATRMHGLLVPWRRELTIHLTAISENPTVIHSLQALLPLPHPGNYLT